MKQLLFISISLVLLFSCKKDFVNEPGDAFLQNKIKSQLKDSLSIKDFENLDFENMLRAKESQSNFKVVKIPFSNKTSDAEFILLKVENDQSFSIGKIFELTRNPETTVSKSQLKFNGSIKIYSLSRLLHLESPVTNGFVDSLHPIDNNILSIRMIPEIPLLPEVVVVASYPKDETSIPFYSYWLNFNSMISQTDLNEGDGGGGSWIFGGNIGTGGSGITNNPQYINIDYERTENLVAIDIKKYIQCFNNIPDVGATCSIKILTDLPVDKDANVFFNWEDGSPGHTFLQITKVNGNQSAQQNIGFYPNKAWKNALTTAPDDGKFVNNAMHEFNASLSMNLTPEQLKSTLIHMQYLANFIKYDIDDYNCTDFAMEVFNYKRGGNQLTIPKYDLPGGTAPNGSSTPQGLYQKLNKMKSQGDSESANIIIPGVKGFAGSSSGPCN